MPLSPRIYLASRSPRRRELLHQINVSFESLLFRSDSREDTGIGEEAMINEDVQTYVVRVAHLKARTGVTLMRQRRLIPQLVLAADTTVEVDGEILGKPENTEQAVAMLQKLAGRTHRVLTAVALADDDRIEQALSISEVRMRAIEPNEIRRYVATGEPIDKAGGYAIQGRAAMFIEEIKGSYSGIMGLPLFETVRLLRLFNYPV